jgi:hypothetical protein
VPIFLPPPSLSVSLQILRVPPDTPLLLHFHQTRGGSVTTTWRTFGKKGTVLRLARRCSQGSNATLKRFSTPPPNPSLPPSLLGRPFSRGGVVSPPISPVELGDFGNQGVVGVWVRQQGANGEEDLPKERGEG